MRHDWQFLKSTGDIRTPHRRSLKKHEGKKSKRVFFIPMVPRGHTYKNYFLFVAHIVIFIYILLYRLRKVKT